MTPKNRKQEKKKGHVIFCCLNYSTPSYSYRFLAPGVLGVPELLTYPTSTTLALAPPGNLGMQILWPHHTAAQSETLGIYWNSAHPFSLRGSKLSFPSSNSHGQDSWHSGCAQIQNQPSWGQFWGTGIQNGKTENAHQSLTECPLSVWAVPRLRFPRPLSISEGQM